jgi:hypothetical protein
MDEELRELLEVRGSSKEEIDALHAQAKQNLRMRNLSPDALSNIEWFKKKELKEATERINAYRDTKLAEIENGRPGLPVSR